MAEERFIKDEGGKKVVYVRDTSIMGFLSPERRIGEVKEKSIVSGGERHEFVPDSLFGTREDVREVRTGLMTNDRPLPLMRPNDYELRGKDGGVERYVHDSWRGTYERSDVPTERGELPPSSRGRERGGTSVLRSSYGGGSAASSEERTPRREGRPAPRNQDSPPSERPKQDSDAVFGIAMVALFGVALFFGGLLFAEENDPTRPEPPEESLVGFTCLVLSVIVLAGSALIIVSAFVGEHGPIDWPLWFLIANTVAVVLAGVSLPFSYRRYRKDRDDYESECAAYAKAEDERLENLLNGTSAPKR